MNRPSEYVYICNDDDCQELHEDQTDYCDSCPSDTREVHRGDMQMETQLFTREEMVEGLVEFEKEFYNTSLIGEGYGYKEMIQDMVVKGELFTKYPTFEEYHSKFRQFYSTMTDKDLFTQHSTILDGLYEN